LKRNESSGGAANGIPRNWFTAIVLVGFATILVVVPMILPSEIFATGVGLKASETSSAYEGRWMTVRIDIKTAYGFMVLSSKPTMLVMRWRSLAKL
jgi:hypothetical protein